MPEDILSFTWWIKNFGLAGAILGVLAYGIRAFWSFAKPHVHNFAVAQISLIETTRDTNRTFPVVIADIRTILGRMHREQRQIRKSLENPEARFEPRNRDEEESCDPAVPVGRRDPAGARTVSVQPPHVAG